MELIRLGVLWQVPVRLHLSCDITGRLQARRGKLDGHFFFFHSRGGTEPLFVGLIDGE